MNTKPYAYSYRLSQAVDTTKAVNDPTRYVQFDETPRLNFTPPTVPEGAVKDLMALYAVPINSEETSDEAAAIAGKYLNKSADEIALELCWEDGYVSQTKVDEFWKEIKKVLGSALTQVKP